MESTELTVDQKVQLLLSVGEECVTEAEIRNLVAKKPNFILYDGFEPSGRMHIAQGVFKAMNVNKCTKAGGIFVFWVADWFALMNDKQGGDLDKIQTVGKYLIEVWKAIGMDMERVKFLWSSEEINSHADEYWGRALDITRHFGIHRITKCCTIMGRKEGSLTAAQILYPIMQCTDVFFLKADICQLGVDQRKVNMLAREYCEAAGIKLKPVILSHHMLYGLLKGQLKMSKSNPMSAVFMEDDEKAVEEKLTQGYCPITFEASDVDLGLEEGMSLVEDKLKNPCLDYVRHIIFCLPNATFTVNDQTFHSADEVEKAFFSQKLTEIDLKNGLIVAINKLIEPVREHFRKDENAKALLETIAKFTNEPKPVTTIRRLKLPEEVTKPTWVVFAPISSPVIRVETIFNLIKQLEEAPTDKFELILILPDYSSFALNSCKGERKIISAIYTVIVESLKALKPDLMKTVRVILQSQWVLSNPNDYWISVINVGRKISLDRVRLVNESQQTAGLVISSLMHVALVMATNASVLCGGEDYLTSHKLAVEFIENLKTNEFQIPEIKSLHVPDLKLKVPKEGFDDPDLELLILDTTADTSRKMKSCFCEPQNISFNPTLTLLSLLGLSGPLNVTRKQEYGGDSSYTTLDEIRQAFVNGALHPADIKPIISKQINEFLDKGRNSWKSDPMKKAIADIKQFLKKQSK